MLAGLFTRESPANTEDRTDWSSWFPATNPTWAGVAVNPNTSMQLLAVNGSVRLISDGISTLPTDVFRKRDGMSVEVAAPSWLSSPTVDLTFVEWCGQILVGLLLHGNCYLYVLRNPAGQIVEVIPLDPQKVSVSRVNGRKTYTVDGVPVPNNAEILHLKGMMLPGADVGLSPVEYARQTIGLGLATVEYGSKFFDGEGNMPGVIELPHPAQPATMKNLAEQWRRRRTRAGKGLPGVLEAGATWKATGVTNEQAQFLSTRGFTAAEIAGQMFLHDPSDLGIPVQGTSLTYANLEQRNARRIQVPFLPWMIRVEMAISALLPGPQFFKFNVSGYLRGDLLARYQAAEIAIRNQFATPNEVREKEDMAPLPGGDIVVKPDKQVTREPRTVPPPPDRSEEVLAAITHVRSDILNARDTRPVPVQPERRVEPAVTNVNNYLEVPEVRVSLDKSQFKIEPSPVHVHVPEQRAQEAPHVTVNVEPTPVNIEMPPWPAPNVDVHVELPRVKSKVVRDLQGRIAAVVQENDG